MNIFNGIFDSAITTVVSPADFLLTIGIAFICGIIISAFSAIKARSGKGFYATLALLPAIVSVVIMMVNGNVGTGVAVAGAFSLVRFRSVPGTAREIGAIFLSMGIGLVCGMGYLAYALLVSVILGGLAALLSVLLAKEGKTLARTLKITAPEDLASSDEFDGILEEYTKDKELVGIKTVNMGSLFRYTYNITLKDQKLEKEMIDRLRTANGNLEISSGKQDLTAQEL